MIVVHVTHEAVEKIGGIGAVIAGLVTSEAYGRVVDRTILLGPLLSTDKPVGQMFGPGGKVLYNSLADVQDGELAEKFKPIERTYDARIIYGTRVISEPTGGREVEVEVLLVDVFHANPNRMNLFKAELWKKFAIPSHQFEDIWDYEQYTRLAEPGYEAIKQIGADGSREPVLLLSHEYMGMPTALRATLDNAPHLRTVFYAHEVASVRPIVELHPGHDTMFYNVLRQARQAGRTIEELFPQVLDNYKHPLVRAARYCDHIFAVGDFIVEELRFLDRHFDEIEIDLVYNGIPARSLTFEQRRDSRDRMLRYARNLVGQRPDWIFSHVCRPVLSKALWRDLRVLHQLEPLLRARGEQAVFFLLGSFGGQRRTAAIRQMERVYGWPVGHEKGYPDLCGGEEDIGDMIDSFNRDHEHCRAIFVNQWDWNPQTCGLRMPEDMTFLDIRAGTDLEFGMSVYEPYGISQFEGLSFGALCLVSNVCGCMGFARRAMQGGQYDNIIEADFLAIPDQMVPQDLRDVGVGLRDALENREAERLALLVDKLLPRDEATIRRRIQTGYELASRMSWEHVVEDYFLPSLERAAEQ